MNVSSYLEAFLTIYGWEFYYMIFLMLMLTGLFLYPLLRKFSEIYIDYLGNPDRKSDAHLYEMATAIGLSFFVFFVAVVPMVPADLNKVKINSVCAKEKEDDVFDLTKDSYFKETETRIPVMPWIAIMLGQGINSVIYQASPCTIDITEAQKAVWNAELDADGALLEEYRRFRTECHNRAGTYINDWIKGKDKKMLDNGLTPQQYIERQIQNSYEKESSIWKLFLDSKPSERDRILLTLGLDSELYKDIFYNPGSLGYKILTASEKVAGYTGDDGNGNMSPDNPPTCGDWWQGQGATQGLRVRLAAALSDRTVWRVIAGESGSNGPKECRGNLKRIERPEGSGKFVHVYIPTPEKMKTCKEAIVKELYNGDEKKYTKQLLNFDQGNFARDTILGEQEKSRLRGVVTAAVVSAILSKFIDVDLAGGILNTVTTFYATLYAIKLLLRHLLPMILMGSYMFWGIYMIMGRLTMDAVIKGMILITCINFIPGLWAVMDHLNGTLFKAMYGNQGTSSVFDSVILDIASSAFYVASIFIIFYWVNMAEGVSASTAIKASQSQMQGLSNQSGSAAGKTVGNLASKASKGAGNAVRGIGAKINWWRGKGK